MNESKIEELADILQSANIVEFFHKDFYYEVFLSADSGYIVNIYSSDERDAEGELIEANMIDGGLCSGSEKDAVGFML
jgi:hypothetical protein